MESIFFLLSKFVWAVIAPDSLLLIFVLFAWAMLWRGRIRLAKWSLGFLSIGLLAIALFPMGAWLLYPLETRFPANPELPSKIDGVIVLAGSENALLSALWRQVELGEAAERYLAFLELARRYPDAKLVFTGGSGNVFAQQYKEADVAKTLFEQQGMNVSRVIFERNSRNTFENAVLSKELVKPRAGEKWLLITSAFHMPRSVGIFCKARWPVIPYPVDHRNSPDNVFRISIGLAGNLNGLIFGMNEWVGLLAYYVTRKTADLLPSGCI